MQRTIERIRYIDGLRALAVLLVLFHHATKFTTLGPYLMAGRHGVDLFFVISGFCLSFPTLATIYDQGAATFTLPRFFAKRLLRIAPPYYIAIVVLVFLGAGIEAFGYVPPESMVAHAPLDIAKQLVFADYNLSFSNASFWSLAVEFRWYLLFPFILWLWVRHRKGFWLLGAACALAYYFTRNNGLDLGTLPGFMFGILAADMLLRRDARAKLAWIVLPIMLLLSPWLDRYVPNVQAALHWQIAALCVVLLVGYYKPLQRIFSWLPLTFIGVASYSIYLYHQPIIETLEAAHVTWPLAAGAGLLSGILAWWCIEHVTEMPIHKAPLLRKLETYFQSLCNWWELPSALSLSERSIVIPEPTISPTAGTSA